MACRCSQCGRTIDESERAIVVDGGFVCTECELTHGPFAETAPEEKKQVRGIATPRIPEDCSPEWLDVNAPLEGWPVCPKCLNPVHPQQYYCNNCDSNQAANPMATYLPFVNIRFMCGVFGTMWRKIWYEKEVPIPMRCVYLGVIILGPPIYTLVLLVFGLPELLIGKIKDPQLQKTARTTFYVIVFALLAICVIYVASSAWRELGSPVLPY